MDILLKKVYSLHKQSVNEVNTDLAKCRERLETLEDRNKELETKNTLLLIENKEGSKRNSNGSCCEVVKQSLQEVITSYKQLLEDKNERIRFLESEVKKYRRRFSTADSLAWDAAEESQEKIRKRLKHVTNGNSPDSTSKSTPARDGTTPSAPGSASPDYNKVLIRENVPEKSADESLKLRLQRRGKRSRYSEDISPEMKRPRHTLNKPSDDMQGGKQSKKVLVQDTCNLQLYSSIDDSKEARTLKRKNRLEDTVLVVPETMAVDDDCVEEELDDEDIASNEFKHKLSNIEEMSEITDCDINDVNKTEEHLNEIKRNNEKDVCEEEGMHDLSLRSNGFKLQSVFHSPESDDQRSCNDSLYEAISDMGASIVDDSDNDVVNSRNRETDQMQLNTTHRSHPLGGRCKNIEEVNEMFETPVSKSNTRDNKTQQNEAAYKKKMFKKSVKTNLKNAEEQVLRRSPRKNKVFYDRNERTKSESPAENVQNSSIHVGNDLTLVPEHDDRNTSTENQSMDLYQIVPVKNGVPVNSKQFQMKVRKNKYDTKGSLKQNNIKHGDKFHNNENLQIVNMKVSKVPEVVTVSSPSIGSLSDPDSPLLLKNTTITECTERQDTSIRETTGSRSRAGSSQSSPCKFTRSRTNVSHQNLKRDKNIRKTSAIDDEGVYKNLTESPRSKSLRQTTLTQRFFSPNSKQTKEFKSKSNNGVKKRTLTFQDMPLESDDEVMVTGESFSFKKPENPVKRDSLSLKRKGKQSVDFDETVQPGDEHILQDVSSKHLNHGDNNEWNGSLDPAAELTVLCQEPESLENQLGKSLPSLDTDFCPDDLVSWDESQPKTSTLVAEEPEDIPSSYRFMPKKKSKDLPNKENEEISLNDSFDRRPKKPVDEIAHIAVVRKKDERQKLQGYGCKQCEEYYKSAGRNEEEIKQHMNQCSRHRAQYLPPDTPPHFWDVGFIDTQECVDRGYLKVEDERNKKGESGATHRRRRKLNKYFRSKTEGTPGCNDSDEELVYE